MTAQTLVLASQSPRRQQLLTQLGLSFDMVIPAIDESFSNDESIVNYAKRMAREKAVMGFQKTDKNPVIIIGADTCGEIDGVLLGKPQNIQDAQRLLRLLSSKRHCIHSAFALFDGVRLHSEVVTSYVTMRAISDDEILAYWHTGEPRDKAGAYAIQGLGAKFISHLSGSYSAVMGLPLFELANALQTFQTTVHTLRTNDSKI